MGRGNRDQATLPKPSRAPADVHLIPPACGKYFCSSLAPRAVPSLNTALWLCPALAAPCCSCCPAPPHLAGIKAGEHHGQGRLEVPQFIRRPGPLPRRRLRPEERALQRAAAAPGGLVEA